MNTALSMVCADLDQTLLFSPGASARLGGQLPAQVVERLDGEVVSTMADVVRLGLAVVAAQAVFVPATTRSQAQYERIDLGVRPRFAVVASGAGVLVEGVPDGSWARSTRLRLAEDGSPLPVLAELVESWRGRPWLLRCRDADGVFLVAQVDPAQLGTEELDELAAACVPHGWRAVHQGRKLYLLPSALHKAHAVAYVRGRLAAETGNEVRLLAAGDTMLDWELLCAADAGWFPSGSELDRRGMRAPHVVRTRLPGLAGSAQIVEDWRHALAGQRPVASLAADDSTARMSAMP